MNYGLSQAHKFLLTLYLYPFQTPFLLRIVATFICITGM